MRKRVLTLLVVLVVTAMSLADEKTKSGLKPKDDLPGPFRAYNVTGKFGERIIKEGGKDKEVEGNFHCLVCDHGLDPTVMIFVRNANVNEPPKELNLLLKDLNTTIQKNRKTRLGGFAVFLSDEVADVVSDDKERFELARKLRDNVDKEADLKHGENVVLAIESKKYLDHYPLDDKAKVIVVLYKDLRVVETLNFPDALTEKDVATVLAKAREMVAAEKK